MAAKNKPNHEALEKALQGKWTTLNEATRKRLESKNPGCTWGKTNMEVSLLSIAETMGDDAAKVFQSVANKILFEHGEPLLNYSGGKEWLH